ncbi:UDP-N-acetylglucosamine--undecaprenyl-phosphate N-acetylglucosaminephosphotransferase [soil metagenome]
MGMDPWAFGLSGLLTGALVWFLEPLAHRHGLVDRPSGRKDHSLPTPITGGLAIAVAAICTLFVVDGYSTAIAAYCAASALILLVGFLDDAYDVRWYWRILCHVAAGLIMVYWGGVRVENLGAIFTETPISLGIWSAPFTLFVTVGLINAMNMADGSDGLAGSLCLAALLMLGAAAVYAGNLALATTIVPLAAAVAAFLLFNMRFPWQRRARVFLGNAGSAFLGFTLAWIVFRLTQDAAHPVSPVLTPWFLLVPIIDCVVLIVRRVRMRRSPFHADRGHIHHLMLDAGFKPAQVVAVLVSVSLVLGALATLVLRANSDGENLLVAGFVMLTGSYYWITSRRGRALLFFRRMHRFLTPSGTVVATPSLAHELEGLAEVASPAPARAGDGGVHAMSLEYRKTCSEIQPKHGPRRQVRSEKNPASRKSGS